MGNSLLDVVVFGRRAGAAAAERAAGVEPGGLTLSHLRSFHDELRAAGIEPGGTAPMLLPEYRRATTVDKNIRVLP